MSQAEARARAKENNKNKLLAKKIAANVGRWFFPAIGFLVFVFGVLTYMSDRGESSLEVATTGVNEAKEELALKENELKEAWLLALESSIGTTSKQLSLVEVAEPEVISYAKSLFSEPLGDEFVLDSYDPLLLSVGEDFSLQYVVELTWYKDVVVDKGQSGEDGPQSDELPVLYPGSAGILGGASDNAEVGNSRQAIVWFTIGNSDTNPDVKQVKNLRGGRSTVSDRSNES